MRPCCEAVIVFLQRYNYMALRCRCPTCDAELARPDPAAVWHVESEPDPADDADATWTTTWDDA